MTLIPYTNPPSRVPRADRLQETAELAQQIAGTDFVPTGLRNNPAAITAAILYGDEVGVGPMQSLARIAVINGRPTLAAETQRALILAAGHDLWVEESTATKCTICGRRQGSEAVSRITWTLDDARRANLAGKPPWKMYPRQMLLARASAELARAVFPDAIGGLAASEELEDGGLEEVGNGATAATPPPKTSKRRRASVTAPATTPDAPPPTSPELPPLPGEEPEPETVTESQRRKLHAMFRENDLQDRTDRLNYCSLVLGRDLKTSTEMSKDEASRVIDHLEQFDRANPDTWPKDPKAKTPPPTGEADDIPF
jgi:hypothetical protein